MVDPVTGRAQVVRVGMNVPRVLLGGKGGCRTRNAKASQQQGSDGRRILAPSYDSQLEADRADYLFGLQLAGDVRKYLYHPPAFPISNEKEYTADFMVWWADFSITIEEIKGSLKMKNVRDSLTRLSVAAGLYPMFHWQLITRGKREWHTRRMR